jgi:hypothetical protein
MAFGQASGSPASAQQTRALLTLLQAAGHSDFRDARGPMGFTQRQAGGKFSRDEAQAFIDQLETEAYEQEAAALPAPAAARSATPARAPSTGTPPGAARAPVVRLTTSQRALQQASDADLAAEARRRGWTVTKHG